VLGGKPLAAGAQRIEDSKALSDAVAADPYGIGFHRSALYSKRQTNRCLGEGNAGAAAHPAHRGNGRLSSVEKALPLHARNPSNKYTRQFVEFALSKKGQDVVGASGFVAQNVCAGGADGSADAPAEYKWLTKDANRLSLDFRFASGQTELDNKAKVDLDRVVSLIADLKIPGDKVMLFGFSDGIGSPAAIRRSR
jgi:phosphate transport system substrate-binding protein